MFFVAIAGENAPQLCEGMKAVLGRLCHVASADGSRLSSARSEVELLLWHGCGDLIIKTPHPILVFGKPGHTAERIEVPDDCVVIADCEDEAAAGFAARRGLCLLDCGLCSKASLTFSSMGQKDGVISLQRSITDIFGQSIEPFDLPLELAPKPYYPLLASVGTLMLCGMPGRLTSK